MVYIRQKKIMNNICIYYICIYTNIISTEPPKENIWLYYRSQMNSNYKQEERNLKSIIETNIKIKNSKKNSC